MTPTNTTQAEASRVNAEPATRTTEELIHAKIVRDKTTTIYLKSAFWERMFNKESPRTSISKYGAEYYNRNEEDNSLETWFNGFDANITDYGHSLKTGGLNYSVLRTKGLSEGVTIAVPFVYSEDFLKRWLKELANITREAKNKFEKSAQLEIKVVANEYA